MPYDLSAFDGPQNDPGEAIRARLAQALASERGAEQPAGPLEGAMGQSRQYFPALAAMSGMQQAPPRRTMGAFMDDPFERAAYRQAGRQVGPPERGTDADIAQAAMVMAPAPLRAVMSAPKIATAGLAAYNFLSGTDSAGGAPAASNAPPGDAQTIMKLQEELRPYGYTGPIDGIWKGGTQRAYEAKQQADQLRVQQDAAQTERDKAASLKIDAEARAKETERLRLEGETKAAQRETGNARLNEMENDVSPAKRALRDYSMPIGVGAGLIGGSLARAGVAKTYNYFSKQATDKAERLFESTVKSAPKRVARVNEFWRKGGAKGDVPFTSTPDKTPGFTSNPGAKPIEDLYQPSAVKNLLTDFGVAGGFGAEMVGGHYVGEGAKDELRAANEAAQADPSEINIRRLQAAKDNVAYADVFMNMGRTGMAAYGGSAMKFKRRPSEPSGAAAEAEKLDLEALLRKKTPATKSLPGSQSAPANHVGLPPSAAGPAAWMARQKP